MAEVDEKRERISKHITEAVRRTALAINPHIAGSGYRYMVMLSLDGPDGKVSAHTFIDSNEGVDPDVDTVAVLGFAGALVGQAGIIAAMAAQAADVPLNAAMAMVLRIGEAIRKSAFDPMSATVAYMKDLDMREGGNATEKE